MINQRNGATVIRSAGLATVILLLFFPDSAVPQDKFVAIPDESIRLYHFDFERNFFSSPAVEKAEREQYNARLQRMEDFKGRVASSSGNLLHVLNRYNNLLVEFMRHYTYFYLKYAVDTKDETSRNESSRMDADFSRRTAFLREEIMRMDSGTLDAFMRREPGLGRYAFAIESIRRFQPHTLPLGTEETLSAISPVTTGWQDDLYETLLDRSPFGTVITGNGVYDVRRDRRTIAIDTNRSVREEGFKKLYAGYASQRDLYALTLIRTCKAGNTLAQLHHFQDSPDETYFDRYWTKPEVTSLLAGIRALSGVHKRYERLRADYVKKKLGYHEVNMWDVSAAFPGESVPRFTIEQARTIIANALSPLGVEYDHELVQLLDPRNGRLDIVPGGNRKSGGFSKGFPGVTTVFFSGGFKGYYNDVRVLTHEAGHAIHRQLMKNNHVQPVYADGPNYLFESFSIFNELLLPEYLYHHESNASRRRYYLEQFFEGKGTLIFVAAQEAALEQEIYEGVQHGTIQSADDLDSVAKHIGGEYSIWPEQHDQLKMSWITSSLFYEDPLYDINYVYGSMLALKYYDMYTRDPGGFISRYSAMMKNGFDAPPSALLQKFLGIDLHDPNLVIDAVRVIESKLKLLESEYSE